MAVLGYRCPFLAINFWRDTRRLDTLAWEKRIVRIKASSPLPGAIVLLLSLQLRDCPERGMFIYGVYVWGCAWDKMSGSGEILDVCPRSPYMSALPVIHVQAVLRDQQALHTGQETPVGPQPFSCPCYHSRSSREDGPVLMLDVPRNEDVPTSRWSLRGMFATLQPF